MTHCTQPSKQSACRQNNTHVASTNFAKIWFANVNMTSYCDVTSSVYPVTTTTIRQCSILQFCRGGIQWSSRPRHHQTSARHCSYIIINESFRAYFRRILNSCVVSKTFKLSSVNRGCHPSQRHVFSARLLFDKIFAQPDVFADVNCSVVG